MGRKCLDYINDLNDYLDGELDPSLCEEIEKHIGHCENCRIMVDTMKQTVTLCREGKPEKLPAALEDKLGGILKARWEKKFGK
ncbi:MAG: zf-HC2 domain-containing protein [Candidatus Zixiibacteriota bacterium]|nr:MAG: zf-HC2 domain-containing protein [candidate division Zixibacteria bacterium]